MDSGRIDYQNTSLQWRDRQVKVLDGIALSEKIGSSYELVLLKLAENIETDDIPRIAQTSDLESLIEEVQRGDRPVLFGAGFGLDAKISDGKTLNWGALEPFGFEENTKCLKLRPVTKRPSSDYDSVAPLPSFPAGGDSGGALFNFSAKIVYGIAVFNLSFEDNNLDLNSKLKLSTACFISLVHHKEWLEQSAHQLGIHLNL